MKFTPKITVGSISCGILTIAALGWNGSVNYAAPAPAQIVSMQGVQASPQINRDLAITPAVELIPPASAQRTTQENYIPVTHWYKNKHWWKRNAPIIGGVAGGGLIGGLAGGGKGALIGGAIGGGGGALYKHYSHKHHRGEASRSVQPTPNQREYSNQR